VIPESADIYSGPHICSVLLGDKEIRHWLKQRLSLASPSPKAMFEELRVYNGNAIADVVTIHNNAHCYEIKSDKDSIERAQKQAQFYDVVFRKVTLVTTARHVNRAEGVLPSHWGIVVARPKHGKVVFSHVRSAGISAKFDKRLALLTLWRSELADLAEPISVNNTAKLSRKTLSELLAENFSSARISEEISKQLMGRAQNLKSLNI
jgi:hypothetical protein